MNPLLCARTAASLPVLAAGSFAAAEVVVRSCVIPAPTLEAHHHPCGLGWLAAFGALVLLAIGTPLLAWAAQLLATRRWRGATAALGTPFVVAVLLGGLLGGPEGALYAAIVPASFIVVGSPLLLLCIRAARKVDLDASDELLASGAAWFVAAQVVTWCGLGLGLGVPLLGIALGGGVAALAVARIVSRRRWATRALRGEIEGLCATRLGARFLVIERVAPPPSEPYRAAPSPNHPIAVVPYF